MALHIQLRDIVFNGDKNRYQSGEEVSGVIKFALKGSAIVANIKISLICVSEVKWIETPGTHYHNAGYIYHDKLRLINVGYTLPKKYECLSEGEHEVPFSFKLPEKGIPSSFIGPHGTIKYYVEVVNEESGIEEGHRVGLQEFIVEAPFRENLNLSIGCSKEKHLGILSLGRGHLTLYASLSKKGWYPGEMIELHCTVDNSSTLDATPKATLYQTQIYMCEERHKARQVALTDDVVGKKVDEKTNFTETLLIKLPEDTPLTIKSAIISVKYFLHVTLDIPHAFDIHVNVPLVVTAKNVLSSE
jgi:hypothetical protein